MNILFYTLFYWKWPANYHVFVKWPAVGQNSWTTLLYAIGWWWTAWIQVSCTAKYFHNTFS